MSADNIDFRHDFTKPTKGVKNALWPGTTVQVVQPIPGLEIQPVA